MKTREEIKLEIAPAFKEIVNAIEKIEKAAYDEGEQDALNNLDEPELSDAEQEKIGVEYAVNAFKDCVTLSDFRSKFQEIESRSFNFMPTLGLKTSLLL